jgi:hypothetical protein
MAGLLLGFPSWRSSGHGKDLHPFGGGEGEEGIRRAVVKLDLGKTDLGYISHDILDFGLEDPISSPIHEKKQSFQAPLGFMGRQFKKIVLLGSGSFGPSDLEVRFEVAEPGQEGRGNFSLEGLGHGSHHHLLLFGSIIPESFSIGDDLLAEGFLVCPTHFPRFFEIYHPFRNLLLSQAFDHGLLEEISLEILMGIILLLDFGHNLIQRKGGALAQGGENDRQRKN